MALFGFGKEKKEQEGGSQDLALAYLEDAQRVKCPFTLKGPRQHELPATLHTVDEVTGILRFQTGSPLMADKGAKLGLAFVLEGVRLGATVRIVDIKPNSVTVEIPEALELMERRKFPRARLNPKEGSLLTALTGIFEGVGITGFMENISEGGARIRVEKAMNIKGEKRLPLGTILVPTGQAFVHIKVKKVPKCPMIMEGTGTATYLEVNAGSLAMGFALEGLRPDSISAIRAFVVGRANPVPTVIPPKTRRKAETAPDPAAEGEEAKYVPVPLPAADPVPVAPSAPPAAGSPDPAVPLPPAAPPPPSPPPAAEDTGAAAPRNAGLLRMKKRSRAVVVLAPSPAVAELFRGHLQDEGYGRIFVTTSRTDLLECLQQPNLGLLVIDGDLSTLEALELVSRLQESCPKLPPVVLASQEVSRALVLAAHRNGVSHLLVKPYAFDAALSTLLEETLL